MTENLPEILLVEDDPGDAELTVHAFRKNELGECVRIARDGEEALELLFGDRDDPCRPDVILLDLKLPGIDGLELLRRIRADSRTRTIPVVVLTASPEDSDRVESYNLGASSYIVKPVDFDKFLAAAGVFSLYWRSSAKRREAVRA